MAQGVITTFAGSDKIYPNGSLPPLTTSINPIGQLAATPAGDVYFIDVGAQSVLKLTAAGSMSVVAGNGLQGFSGDGGPAVNASLNFPQGVAVDAKGTLFIADSGNCRVRKVTPDGTITTVAGTGDNTYFGEGVSAVAAGVTPNDVTVDNSGNLYIADKVHFRVRRVSADGIITTVAGAGVSLEGGDNGPAVNAGVLPQRVAVDQSGNLYISDFLHLVRKVDTSGIITTFAGKCSSGLLGDGGSAVNACLALTDALATDSTGRLFIVEANRIRQVTLASGVITTVAGNGNFGDSGDRGPAAAALLNYPSGVSVDQSGAMYIIDSANNKIRKIDVTAKINTIAGNGSASFSGDRAPATSSLLAQPNGIAADLAGNIYIADANNNRIRKVTRDGVITTVAGAGAWGDTGDDGAATAATLSEPSSVAVDNAGSLYIAEYAGYRVRRVDVNGRITTFAGGGNGSLGNNGPATNATLDFPASVAVDSSGNVYVAELGFSDVRKIDRNGIITAFAGMAGLYSYSGDGGPATQATLNYPTGVAADASGNVYIADYKNGRIRMVNAKGVINTVAVVPSPIGLTVDSAGFLYIACGDGRVRRGMPNGVFNAVAGSGAFVFNGDGGPPLNAGMSPISTAIDSRGILYITDSTSNRIRAVLSVAPAFLLSAATASFSVQQGGAASTQTVAITGSVPGLGYTTSTNAPWLQASPQIGTVPGTITITVEPSTLTPGSYTGIVTITAPLASPPTQQVSVSVTVSASPNPSLVTGSSTLNFGFVQGSSPSSTALSVSNPGSSPLAFTATATADKSWLTISPANALTSAAQPATLTVTATPGSLAPGTYAGNIVVSGGSGQTATVPVVMTISAVQKKILLSQSGLSFLGSAGGGPPLPQSFGVLNVGNGAMPWTAQAVSTSGGPISWLSIAQPSGTVATPFVDASLVDVTVDPSGLSAGVYYGQVRVMVEGADNSPQYVTVVLSVQPAGTILPPEVRPSGLLFTGTAGSAPGSQDVTLGAANAQASSYTSTALTADGGKWLNYLPLSSAITPGKPSRMAVQPDFSALTAGSVHKGVITILFNDSTTAQVNVTSVVAPSASPSAVRNGKLAPRASGCPNSLQMVYAGSQQSLTIAAGSTMNIDVRIIDDCGHPITSSPSTSVTASFSTGDPTTNLVSTTDGHWVGTWQPRKVTTGQATVDVTAFVALANNTLANQISIQVTLAGGASDTPVVKPGAVVNSASFAQGEVIAPGSLVTIFGSALANTTAESNSTPLLTTLADTEVWLNDRPLPLLYASGQQINVQIPYDLPVNTPVQLLVRRANGAQSYPETISMAGVQPGVFINPTTGLAIIVNPGGELNSPASPAHPGDTVVIYCTGLGLVNSDVPAGTAATGPVTTLNPVTVSLDGAALIPYYAGLTPGYPGLYQINVTVPNGTPPNDRAQVVISAANLSSQTVTMAVR